MIEDDVTLPADLGSVAEAAAEHLTGAEVALLSVDCYRGGMKPEGAEPLPSSRLLALPIDISQPRSTGAYVITREACERMVKSLLPVQVQADAVLEIEGLLTGCDVVPPTNSVSPQPHIDDRVLFAGQRCQGTLVEP